VAAGFAVKINRLLHWSSRIALLEAEPRDKPEDDGGIGSPVLRIFNAIALVGEIAQRHPLALPRALQ
jgi:hypothetical protein